MISLLNLPTSEWTTAHARYIFRKGGSGTVTFDMYTSTDYLWQYVAYTIKRAPHARLRRPSSARINSLDETGAVLPLKRRHDPKQ